MQKLVTRICWTNRGVRLFTKDVNDYLDQGYALASLNIEKKGLRFICFAIITDLPLELGEEVESK
jgi:hypothetical protein